MKTEKDRIISGLKDELKIAKSRIKKLEEDNAALIEFKNNFGLNVWSILEPIFNPIYTKEVIHFKRKIRDEYNKYKSLDISPKDIVFIITIDKRLKAICIAKDEIKELLYEESNDHKLDWYCNSFDIQRHFLVKINRNLVVNAKHFELMAKGNLKPLFEMNDVPLDKKHLSKFNKIPREEYLNNFNQIKQGQINRNSLQEKLLHYK